MLKLNKEKNGASGIKTKKIPFSLKEIALEK